MPPARANVSVQQHVEANHHPGLEQRFQPSMGLGHAQLYLDEQGVARFPHVGLGMQLDVAGRFQTAGNEWTMTTVAGPRSAGEEAVAELTTPVPDVVLVFRLVRPDGRPTEGHPYQGVLLWLDAAGEPLASEQLGSNSMDETRRVKLPSEEPAGWTRREYHLRRQRQPGEITLTVSLDLSAPLAPGEHDLGDILLHEPPLIAGGIVVNEQGAPVAAAEVTVIPQTPDERSARTMLPQVHSFITGADGRFRVVGEHDGGPATVLARHALHRDGQVALVGGAADHRIVLERGCEVSGVLIADEGVALQELSVKLVRDGEPDRTQNAVRVQRDGRFQVGGLAPGSAKLRLLHRNGVVHEVGDLLLTPGAAPDPRLNPLDLRGKLHPIRVRVADADGDPVHQFEVKLLDASGIEAIWINGWDGELSLLSPTSPATLGVRARQHLAQVVEHVSGTAEVRLSRASETLIVLQDPAIMQRFPGAGATLRWQSSLGNGLRDDASLRFDADGSGRLTLPGSGEYRICLTVPIHQGEDWLLVHGADPRLWPLLLSPPGATPERFLLPASLAEVERALVAAGEDE